MARNQVVPFNQLERRAPEAGRIRIGVKSPIKSGTNKGKMRPDKIKTFRFTSQHRDLIEQLALEFGGQAGPWNEPDARIKEQWQVITTTNQMRVWLPQGGLHQDYELWRGGGRDRRCDGVTVETVEMHGDSAVPVQSPCICTRNQQRECQPKTRINVILPQLPMVGLWRLETGSWAAAHEMPGMYEMISALQQGGILDCLLGVEERSDRVGGRSRTYVVPTLGLANTALELQAGQAAVHAIGGGARAELGVRSEQVERPALGTGSFTGVVYDADEIEPTDVVVGELQVHDTPQPGGKFTIPVDDGIIDAELVDDDTPDDILARFAEHFELDVVRFVDAVNSMGPEAVVAKVIADLNSGAVQPVGFSDTGTVKWKQNLSG